MAKKPTKVWKGKNPYTPYDTEEQFLLAQAQSKVVSAIIATKDPECREQMSTLYALMCDMQELLEEEFDKRGQKEEEKEKISS